MILILSLAMFINDLTNIGKPFINISNQIVAGIIFLYLLFVIFTSNPFLKITNPPPNGIDLNPLLQDPLLIIHPPILFTGYVLYAITFSLVISGMFILKFIMSLNLLTPCNLLPFSLGICTTSAR